MYCSVCVTFPLTELIYSAATWVTVLGFNMIANFKGCVQLIVRYVEEFIVNLILN